MSKKDGGPPLTIDNSSRANRSATLFRWRTAQLRQQHCVRLRTFCRQARMCAAVLAPARAPHAAAAAAAATIAATATTPC